jgi:hypothetical protein
VKELHDELIEQLRVIQVARMVRVGHHLDLERGNVDERRASFAPPRVVCANNEQEGGGHLGLKGMCLRDRDEETCSHDFKIDRTQPF